MSDNHDRHEHLDEGTIHAWLDGALPPDESQRVESLAATCAECAALVAEARGLIAASSRILASLDAVPGGVIPGTSADGDQLAALRARRQAGARRWWQDRRIVVAASLVFVAGVSSLVWRASIGPVAETRSAQLDQAVQPPTTEPVIVTAPAPPAAPRIEAADRDMKAAAPVSRELAPRRVAATLRDSTAERKVAEATAPLSSVVANKARRLDSAVIGRNRGRTDSIPVVAQVQSAPFESQLRQQRTVRQAPQQLQSGADSSRRAAAPPVASERLRLAEVVVTGVGAAVADAGSLGGSCFLVRSATSGRESTIPDTLQLHGEQVPVLSDPAWFRATGSGALRDSTLAWRSVDSVTVELRVGYGAASTGTRFTTTGGIPDVRGLSGTRAISAARIRCPN